MPARVLRWISARLRCVWIWQSVTAGAIGAIVTAVLRRYGV
ncbi:hypothetical protein GCM10010411_74110 [Actinomadura fulvescens]|uniref:Uncharacterized protein n=1 Tax=Actinomadura fulvescens TaxID=46160 RepID=A0ABP6CSG0_9ACTN